MHPSSNGQAERAGQIFKKGMKRSTSDSLETRVSRFLFHYRTTPNTTTGHTPAELMMGRQLRSHMTLVRPSIAMQVSANQQRQKDDHDRGSREKEGDPVYVRDFPAGKSWLPGQVKEVQGQSSVVVELDDSELYVGMWTMLAIVWSHLHQERMMMVGKQWMSLQTQHSKISMMWISRNKKIVQCKGHNHQLINLDDQIAIVLKDSFSTHPRITNSNEQTLFL